MKKTIFALMALTLAFAVAFVACKKDDKEKTPEQVKKDFLVNKKGWTLTAAISDKEYTNGAGVTDKNLFVSYFEDCEKKDVLNFTDDGKIKVVYGKPICSFREGVDFNGTYKLTDDSKTLEIFLPYFVNNDNDAIKLYGQIMSIDEKQVIFTARINFPTPDPAKNIRGPKNSRGDEFHNVTFTYRANQ